MHRLIIITAATMLLGSAWAEVDFNCEGWRAKLLAEGKPLGRPCDGENSETGDGVAAENQAGPSGSIWSRCACENNLYVCRHTLINFGVSEFAHSGMLQFVQGLANDVQTFGAERVRFMQVEGFADGTSDIDGAGKWGDVPLACRAADAMGIFFDEELARVRACMVMEAIQATSGQTFELMVRDVSKAGLNIWNFPTDARYARGEYRKVDVVFSVERGCQ